MLKSALKQASVLLVLAASTASSAWANEINARALELAGEKKFDQALRILSQQDSELQSGYEHRFLKARILSWAEQYEEARIELQSLNQAFPGNPDLQLAMGNLEYYQGNLDAAEANYELVLEKFPGYTDARTGLDNIRRARAAAQETTPKKWRIDGGLGFSELNDDELPNWNTQFLRAEYSPGPLAYHISMQRYNRFGEENIQFQGGISDTVRGGWDWGIEAGFTPNAIFRPDLSLGGRMGRAIELDNSVVLYPNMSYRYDDYAAGGIHTLQPGLLAYLDDGLVLTGRLIGTFQDNETDQIGWLVQARKPVSQKFELNLGYANAPEAIDGISITTKSLFGGLTYAMRDDLDLHLNLARDDREGSFTRNSVNVGFTHKR